MHVYCVMSHLGMESISQHVCCVLSHFGMEVHDLLVCVLCVEPFGHGGDLLE